MFPAVDDDRGRSLLRSQAQKEASWVEWGIISNKIAGTSQMVCPVCHSTRSGLLLRRQSGLISPSSFLVSCSSCPQTSNRHTAQKMHLWPKGAEMTAGHHLERQCTPKSARACAQIDIYQIWMRKWTSSQISAGVWETAAKKEQYSIIF